MNDFESEIIFPVLRDYQIDVRDRTREAAKNCAHPKRVILQASTGAGKSEIAKDLILRCYAKGRRALFIVSGRALVNQFERHLIRAGVPYGIIMSGRGQNDALIQLASKETLAARALRRQLAVLPPADLVLIDEAHESMAKEWVQLLDQYKESVVIGLTATPALGNGKGLGAVYGAMERAISTQRLVEEGWLVPCKVFAPDKPDLRGVGTDAKGDYNRSQLAEKMDKPKITGNVLTNWRKHADGRRTVVFGCTIDHAKHICDEFNAAGIPFRHVDQETEDHEREDIFGAIQDGRILGFTNVSVARRGLDLPCLEVACVVRPTRSLVLWLQMCLDEKTEVLTKDGWKGLHEFSDSDTVASFDPATGHIEWCQPENVFRRPLNPSESMVGITSSHLDIRVTDQHTMIYRPFMAKCRGATHAWEQTPAAELAQRNGNYQIPICGIQPTIGLPLSSSDLRFIGWWLSDGTTDRTTRRVTISQSADSPYHDDIVATLQGCGFKFGTTRVRRTGKYAGYADLIHYRVSHGLPRGTDKHLTGHERLAKYLDKNLSPLLEDATPQQLRVLLDAMFCGDGSKQRTATWKIHTRTITCGNNKTLADRLQSLCVRKGFRCNVSEHSYNQSPIYFVRISDRPYANVGGANADEGRCQLKEVLSVPGELVWCMTTKHGTLVTRRNGKVAILGNCGRIRRPWPGKADCVVIDHAGACDFHCMPDDEIEWNLDQTKKIGDWLQEAKDEGKLPPKMLCPKCDCQFTGQRCPNCGFTFKAKLTHTKEVEYADGILVERGGKAAASIEDMQRYWNKCVAVAVNRNKRLGSAVPMFTDKFKVKPWEVTGLRNVPAAGDVWKQVAAEVFPDFKRVKVKG